MNEDLLTPGVPTLSDEWIAQRTQHLMEELTTPSPRRKRRFVLTGASAGAVAAAASLVGLLGPWSTPAFAGWSSQPTSPSSVQLSAAESACAQLATNLANVPGGTNSAPLQPIALSDARGPYTLIVYGTSNSSLCVSGTNLTSLHETGGTISVGSSAQSAQVTRGGSSSSTLQTSNTNVPAPASAVVNLSYSANQNGQTFAVAEGSVGSQVSGATLLLSDGSSVVATVNSGLFAAWWPGQATVSSIQVTTTTGN